MCDRSLRGSWQDAPIHALPLQTGVTLSYRDSGDPTSPLAVVLLPGLGDSCRSWDLVTSRLPTSVRVLAISQRGHGDSDKPKSGYGVTDFEADLGAFVDALALPRVVLVGHSSASLVVRRFAINHPDRVAGIVLEGSFLTLGPIPDEVRATFATLEDPLTREFVRDFAAGTFHRPPAQQFLESILDDTLEVPARVWREIFASLVDYDDASELPTLQTPTLIIWGDRDTIISRDATDALARSIASSTLLVYEGVGHTPHWEDPDRFARDLAVFVDKCGR
jgi:non-heme chloroperoxidase